MLSLRARLHCKNDTKAKEGLHGCSRVRATESGGPRGSAKTGTRRRERQRGQNKHKCRVSVQTHLAPSRSLGPRMRREVAPRETGAHENIERPPLPPAYNIIWADAPRVKKSIRHLGHPAAPGISRAKLRDILPNLLANLPPSHSWLASIKFCVASRGKSLGRTPARGLASARMRLARAPGSL